MDLLFVAVFVKNVVPSTDTGTKNTTTTTTTTGGLKRKREIYADTNELPQQVVWQRKRRFWKPFHLRCL